jgi:hypothetical protein
MVYFNGKVVLFFILSPLLLIVDSIIYKFGKKICFHCLKLLSSLPSRKLTIHIRSAVRHVCSHDSGGLWNNPFSCYYFSPTSRQTGSNRSNDANKEIDYKLYLRLSSRYQFEIWGALFICAIPPLIFYLAASDFLKQSLSGGFPFLLSVLVYIPAIFMLAVCAHFPKKGVFQKKLNDIDEESKAWLNNIISTRESHSPVIWMRNDHGNPDSKSPAELFLRYMMDAFFRADDQQGNRQLKLFRITVIFFAPVLLTFFGLYTQMIYWALQGANDFTYIINPKTYFSIMFVLWIALSYGYSFFVLRRYQEQTYVIPDSSRYFPSVIVGKIKMDKENVFNKAVLYGLPATILSLGVTSFTVISVIF